MIEEVHGADLFVARTDAIVNPVNCRGVMGKGIALEVKRRYPNSYRRYKEACDRGKLRPGILLYVPGEDGERNLIHFPTKDHWAKPSRLEWIESGLEYLKQHYAQWGLRSIAMPQIGCGLGGLKWEQVKPRITAAFESEPLRVLVHISANERYGEQLVLPSEQQDCPGDASGIGV